MNEWNSKLNLLYKIFYCLFEKAKLLEKKNENINK
jgi:hypothetical protein